MANITVRGSAKIIGCNIYNSKGYGIYVTKPGTVNSNAGTSNTYQNNQLGNYFEEW